MRARRTKVLFPSTRTCGMLTKAGFWLLYGESLIFGFCMGLNRTWDFLSLKEQVVIQRHFIKPVSCIWCSNFMGSQSSSFPQPLHWLIFLLKLLHTYINTQCILFNILSFHWAGYTFPSFSFFFLSLCLSLCVGLSPSFW